MKINTLKLTGLTIGYAKDIYKKKTNYNSYAFIKNDRMVFIFSFYFWGKKRRNPIYFDIYNASYTYNFPMGCKQICILYCVTVSGHKFSANT